MDFTNFPVEILFVIFEQLRITDDEVGNDEDYGDDGDDDGLMEIDHRSYFHEHFREYDFYNYNAYQLYALSILSKKYCKTFNSDIYWEQILQYKDINLPKKNFKKKYIQSIIRPYFKKIDRYYKCKILEEKTSLKIQKKNIEYLDDLFMDSSENEFGQFMINMKGYWVPTLKDKIPKKSNNWMTMTFETRGYPRKKIYGWEKHVCIRLKKIIKRNIQYYFNEIELSKKRFKSCELYLQK